MRTQVTACASKQRHTPAQIKKLPGGMFTSIWHVGLILFLHLLQDFLFE